MYSRWILFAYWHLNARKENKFIYRDSHWYDFMLLSIKKNLTTKQKKKIYVYE